MSTNQFTISIELSTLKNTTMASQEKFCLKWNDFESNISSAFRELREDKDFFDVTLACEEDQIKAHKVILSACSPFFRGILKRNLHEHPLLYLKGVKYGDLVSVLNFMYHGEVNIAQEELNTFLNVAEELKIKGLTQGSSNKKVTEDNSSRPKTKTSGRTDHSSVYQPSKAAPPSRLAGAKDIFNEVQEVLPVKTEPTAVQEEAPIAVVHDEPHEGEVMSYGDDYMQYENYERNDISYANTAASDGNQG